MREDHDPEAADVEVAAFRIASLADVPEGRRLVRHACATADVPPRRIDAIETAVAEAVMNAIEHGNGGDPSKTVGVHVRSAGRELRVRVTDEGGGRHAATERAAPDLHAKLRGDEPVRGWGRRLIRGLADEVHEHDDDGLHVVDLSFRLEARTT